MSSGEPQPGEGKANLELPSAGSFYRPSSTMADEAGPLSALASCRRLKRAAHTNESASLKRAVAGASSLDDSDADANATGGHNRTTDGQTMMHILKANIGTGVLALPLAFKNVGLWCGLVLVPVIGFICIHCMNILIHSHNNLCDRFNYESLDYDQVASLGLACGPRWARRFAKKAGAIVTVFLMLTQIGFCCVYILFTVENLQVACMNLFGLNYSMLVYLLAIFPVIGLTSCTSNLKHLARISTLANVLQLLGLALIFFDLLQFNTYAGSDIASANSSSIVSASANASASASANANTGQLATGQTAAAAAAATVARKRIVVDQGFSSNIAQGLPLFFATAVYAFEGIGVVLPLVKEMQTPRRISGLNGVLNTSMAMVALLYMAMGFFGYAKYGQTVAGSITLNLPESTLNELVRLAFALAIGLSYGLQFYIPWAYFWPLIDEALFYSYRPRAPRDKLSFLDQLSAENQWAIQKVLEQDAQEARQGQLAQAADGELTRELSAEGRPQQEALAGNSSSALASYHDNSLATTMATSYSMSMSTNFASAARAPAAPRAQQQPHLQQQQHQQQQLTQQPQQHHASQYGTLGASDLLKRAQMQQQQVAARPGRRPRDRFEDVVQRSADEESVMPEVEWRPPPRSMRGKRKLVRYSVILLTVSFTFVAAALIPRLDLFISLIGALASSCLAIIFPAIIQLCTYWNAHSARSSRRRQDDDDDDDEDADDDSRAIGKRACDSCERHSSSGSSSGSHSHSHTDSSGASSRLLSGRGQDAAGFKHGPHSQPRAQLKCACRARPPSWSRVRRSLAWHLFLLKNLFLIVFGLAGLVTGTWVSLRQLGAMGAEV